jgi:hypothetical protein
MVHAVEYDGQNSRPVGSTVIMLEALGLSEEVRGDDFPKRRGAQRWTSFATTCSSYNWGDAALTTLLENKLLTYGPLLHLANQLNKLGTNQISRAQAKDFFQLKNSTDIVSVICPNHTTSPMPMADGNTSTDTASRNTTTMMYIAMALGMVSTPQFYASGYTQSIVGVSAWLNENPMMKAPRSYSVDLTKIQQILINPNLEAAIHCKHFTTKGTHRNNGAGCGCGCGSRNLLNINKTTFDRISRQRKLLLCEALRIAKAQGKKVDLAKLANQSKNNPKFAIESSTHFRELLNIELHNVSLFGAIHSFDDSTNLLQPEVNTPIGAFGTLGSEFIDSDIMIDIKNILSGNSLFV